MTEPHPKSKEVTPPADPLDVGTSGRVMASGSLWAFAVAVLPPAYTFTTSVAVARFFGAAGLGRITFIAFVQTTLVVMLVLGLPTSLMRHVGEARGSGHPGRIRSLVRAMIRPLGCLALLGFVILSSIGLLGGQPRYAWVFAGIACSGAVLHTLPSAMLVGMQRWRDTYIVGLTSGSVGVAAKIGVLAMGAGVTWLFAIDAAVIMTNLIGTTYLARRAARSLLPDEEPAGDLVRRVWRFASVASLGVLITFVVYRRTELFFLKHYSSDAQIALYSVPFSLVEVLILLPRTIGTVIGPAVATLFGAGDFERISSGYSRSLRTVLPLTFFATAGAVAVGPTMVTLLYGPEFRSAGVVLVILISTLPFVPVAAIAGSVLLGIGKQWVPIGTGAVAAAANLGLDWLLIPRYDALGAAIANSSAQIVSSVPLAMYAALCVGSVSVPVRTLVRAALAATCAGGAAIAAILVLQDAVAVPVAIVAFTLVGVPAAVLLRVISSDDAAWLERALPPRVIRPVLQLARIMHVSLPPAAPKP